MCDQTEVAYLPDDVVWVKLGPIWWPGQVVEDDEDVKKSKIKPLAVVKFFDEDNYQEVKNLDQIYSYTCFRKNEFIKKGLDMCRGTGSKPPPSSMKKFPEDIVKAEQLTNGNVNILNDPEFLPEKTESLQVQLGFKQTPKNKKKSKPIVPQTLFSTSRVESPEPESEEKKNSISRIRMQVEYTEDLLTFYHCAQCNYRTEVLELLQYHYPIHSTHDLHGNELPKRNKGVKRKPTFFKSKVSLNEPKRKKKEENGEEKPKVDLRDNILKDWEEENEDNQDSFDESSFLNETDKEGDETKDEKVEHKKEDNNESKEKSCFDFDEEDESINLDSSMKFGQKLPRVITDEKPKKQELPAYDEKDDFGQDLDNLLNETVVPKLPEIPDSAFSDKKTTNGDLISKDSDEKVPKSPSWENSPLKKRRGSKTVLSDSERRSESPKIENSSPFKKRKALEQEEKPITDINKFTNDFLEKIDETTEETVSEPTKEVECDNALEESKEKKLELDFLEKPEEKDPVTESEVINETVIENDSQIEIESNEINVNATETDKEEKNETEEKIETEEKNETIVENNVVIENEKSPAFQENVDNEMIIEENIIEEKIIEEKVEDEKTEEKNIEKDPSEMDLDINSMPIFMGDELIAENSEPEPTGANVKQIKIQLKQASDSKPGDVLSYFKDVNGKQVITIPGKKNVLLAKMNALEKPTSSIQSPKKTQVALNIKSSQLDQKIILVPADSSNGQNIDKLKVTPGTRMITSKGLITQAKTQPVDKVFTKANILASAQGVKPNIVAAPSQKLKLITTKGPNQNVKFITTSNLVSIQRPVGSSLKKGQHIMLVQSPKTSQGEQKQIRSSMQQIRPVVRPAPQAIRPQTKVQLKTVPQIVKTGAKVVHVNKLQAAKPRIAGPNILQKTQRKPPPKPVQKPPQKTQVEQPKVVSIPASSVQDSVNLVYLSVDGSILPVSSVSSPIVPEGSENNIYYETSSADGNKLFLSIDENGQLVPNVTKAPRQDILAKALANTQVLGDNDADFTNYPPLSLSHNVIETSFTMNQPIMTPQEVPSSVTPDISGIDKKFQPLLSDDLESQTVYITENPSTSSHQQYIVLNEGNIVQTTASSTNLNEIIYTQESSLLQEKNQDINDPKTEFQIIQTQSGIELENNSPHVEEEMVIEQVDSLNEPFVKPE